MNVTHLIWQLQLVMLNQIFLAIQHQVGIVIKRLEFKKIIQMIIIIKVHFN